MSQSTTTHTGEARAVTKRPLMPHWSNVLREQVRATWFVLRRPAQIAAAAAALFVISLMLRIFGRGLAFDLNAEPSPIYGLVGAVFPIIVWARDERFGTGFFWTLPVDRLRHALIKVFAGWLWLMAGVALSILVLVILTLVSGGEVLPTETLFVATSTLDAAAPIDPASLRTVEWVPSPLMALVPFIAATVAYVGISALWLASRHPYRWIIGVVVAFALASAASHVASTQLGIDALEGAPERVLHAILEERYGLDAVLSARTASLDFGMRLPSGERVSVWTALPSMSEWATASLLWGGLGIIALFAAAARHREQRRG